MSNKIIGYLPVTESDKVMYAEVSTLGNLASDGSSQVDYGYAFGKCQALVDNLFSGFFEKKVKEVNRYE